MNVKHKCTLVLFIVLALGLPMLLKGPDGRPLMTPDDWLPDLSGLAGQADAASSSLQSLVTTAVADKPVPPQAEPAGAAAVPTAALNPVRVAGGGAGKKLYKWQDEAGRWHFSNEQPRHAGQVSVEDLPDVENVMEAPVSEGAKRNTISLPGGFGLGGN